MVHIHILSLFPESMRGYLDTSMMKKAQENGLFRFSLHNLTDWTVRNTRRVDDRPYGGGAGTILTIEPLVHALRDIITKYGDMYILFGDPKGEILQQEHIEQYDISGAVQYLLICGHYEGVDERIFRMFSIERFSIGRYILSSGELASLVWIDSIVRLIPGVLDSHSLAEESFSEKIQRKKEYPQYSRPELFEGYFVPEVLLSGNHQKILAWKREHLDDES